MRLPRTAGLLPDRMLRGVRGTLARDRFLRTLDNAARSGYDQRVRRAARDG